MNGTNKPDELHDERLAALYRQSRVEEPPMALDSAILQRARQAVEEKPGWWPWLRRFWFAPLATAAVALLTVSVVIQMRQQHPEAVAPAPTLQMTAPAEQKAEPVPDGLLKKEKRALEKYEAAPAAPAASPEGAAPLRQRAAKPAAGKTQMMMENEGVPAKLPAAQKAMRAPAATNAADRTATEPAKAWLQRIRELVAAGKRAEAQAELAAFRKAWPDYPLPPELQPLQTERQLKPERQ